MVQESECEHPAIELHRLTDLCYELVCVECRDVLGFRIEGVVFGQMGGLFDAKAAEQIQATQKKIEGKVRVLTEEEIERDNLK